jgi:hypothetical protein
MALVAIQGSINEKIAIPVRMATRAIPTFKTYL